jgi:ABC-type multidrug transport system fused ATPase/permease subunit
MVETGTHKELLQKTGLYRQLVSKQLSRSGLKDHKVANF